jgi:pimeloyl-[acyl-carrier protein] methyl ester esterase
VNEETRPLLIALHGWGARGCFFDDLAKRLTDTCDVVALDFAGHGTQKQIDVVELSMLVDQINELVLQYKGQRIFLLGWSMGAAAAFSYLEKCGSEQIAGLLIEDMAPKPLNDEDWDLGIASGYGAEDVETTLGYISSGWQRYGRRVWCATFATPQVARKFEDHPLFEAFLDNEERAMSSAWNSLMALDARALIRNIECPVQALMGANSHVYKPQLADWYERILKNGSVHRIKGAGHAPHLEQPEIFADLVSSFIQKHC